MSVTRQSRLSCLLCLKLQTSIQLCSLSIALICQPSLNQISLHMIKYVHAIGCNGFHALYDGDLTYFCSLLNGLSDYYFLSSLFLVLGAPCDTLQTSNSFVRSDTGVVIDSEPHLSRTCKTNLLFAPLAVRVRYSVLHSNTTSNTITYLMHFFSLNYK